MAIRNCALCGQDWDTKQHGECPTCRRIRDEDLTNARLAERAEAAVAARMDVQTPELVLDVHIAADDVDGRAKSLATMVGLVAFLGFLGSAVLILAGFVGAEEVNGLWVAVGVGSALFWLLVRALGLAFVSRIELAAAVARWQVDEGDAG